MRVFVAGATGAIGRRLVHLLVPNGHTVIGTTRTGGKADALQAAGASPVVLDALDRDAVREALIRAEPDVVVHQATSLAGFTDFPKFDEGFAATNRLRTEGTRQPHRGHEGARGSPTGGPELRRVAYARIGGPVKTEDDPLDQHPPEALRRTLEAILYLERVVLHRDRGHGPSVWSFYGPGTSLGEGASSSRASGGTGG